MSSIDRILAVVVATMFVASCDGTPYSPSAPTPPPVAVTPTVVSPPADPSGMWVFREPSTGFSTTDLRDANGRIVRFSNAGELIWTADGTHFPGFEMDPVSSYWGPPAYFIGLQSHIGPTLCLDYCEFSVRFGSENGERRAYLTVDYGHYNLGTLVALDVSKAALIVRQTALYPPGTPTLSGVVTETTTDGLVPIAGASVSRFVPAGWQIAATDQSGFYRISGLIDGSAEVVVSKAGYQSNSQQLALSGDVRFDVHLVRR